MAASTAVSRHLRSFLIVCAAMLLPVPAAAADEAVFFPIVVPKQAAPKTSYLNIPYTAFVGPLNATSALLFTGACWNDNGTLLLYLGAPVNLPHGAVIKEVRVDYYQYYAGDSATMYLYRVSSTSQHAAMATLTCGDAGNGQVATTSITDPTVDNATYSYILQGWGFRCDRKLAIRSVRITYESM